MNSVILAFMCSKFSRNKTASGPTSITSPLSIKSGEHAARLDTLRSHGVAGDRMVYPRAIRGFFSQLVRGSAGNTGDEKSARIADPLRTKSSAHSFAMSASKYFRTHGVTRHEAGSNQTETFRFCLCALSINPIARLRSFCQNSSIRRSLAAEHNFVVMVQPH